MTYKSDWKARKEIEEMAPLHIWFVAFLAGIAIGYYAVYLFH